jgi:hypothetical protein
MMAGADYVPDHPSFVSMVKELSKCNRYRLSLFGVEERPGLDASLKGLPFESETPFPMMSVRPHTIQSAANLARCAISAGLRRWKKEQRAVLTPPAGLSLMRRARYRLLLEQLRRDVPGATRGYDLYHWHTLEPDRLAALAFVPQKAKIVLSSWGSDLLRTAGVDAYRTQLWACERASRIVVYSLELREMLLAKFGRHLLPKVRLASIGGGLFDAVEGARSSRTRFLQSLGISDDKIVVCIGNNGHPSNQHVPAIRALGQLDERHRSRLAVILPVTYGSSMEYLSAIQDAAAAAHLDVRLLRERMTDFETACLRAATDVLLFVPITDSFSAALCEVIAAGGIAITGAWLPYGLMRRHGIHFHEVADFQNIPQVLRGVLDDYGAERAKAALLGPRVKDLKAWDRVIPQWIAVYDELLSSN